MVGLLGSLVGGVVIVALVLVGVWLTWISLRSDHHSPANLSDRELNEAE